MVIKHPTLRFLQCPKCVQYGFLVARTEELTRIQTHCRTYGPEDIVDVFHACLIALEQTKF